MLIRRASAKAINTVIKLHLLVALAIFVATLLPDAAMAEQHPCMTTGSVGPLPPPVVQACQDVVSRLVGTWTLVTYERAYQDGRREPLLGTNPKGILMLDAAGNFTEIVANVSDVKPLNNNMTLEDARALINGTPASYGYFWLTTTNHALYFVASFSSRNRGEEQTAGHIAVLTADDFEYDTFEPYGQTTRFVWKRVR